jgi:hypothetical protein
MSYRDLLHQLMDINTHKRSGPQELATLTCVLLTRVLLDLQRRAGERNTGQDLRYRMYQTREHVCSDPRDRIYALLALISEAERDLFAPDYTKSVSRLYAEVTALFISQVETTRIIPRFVRTTTRLVDREIVGSAPATTRKLGVFSWGWPLGGGDLPSWVMDFNAFLEPIPMERKIQKYIISDSCASPESFLQVELDENGGLLSLKVVYLGTITRVLTVAEFRGWHQTALGGRLWPSNHGTRARSKAHGGSLILHVPSQDLESWQPSLFALQDMMQHVTVDPHHLLDLAVTKLSIGQKATEQIFHADVGYFDPVLLLEGEMIMTFISDQGWTAFAYAAPLHTISSDATTLYRPVKGDCLVTHSEGPLPFVVRRSNQCRWVTACCVPAPSVVPRGEEALPAIGTTMDIKLHRVSYPRLHLFQAVN